MIVKRDVVIRKMMVSQNEGFYFPQDEKNVIETTITIISPMVGAMQNYLWVFLFAGTQTYRKIAFVFTRFFLNVTVCTNERG